MGKDLAAFIETRRAELGLSLTALATAVGVTYPAVQQWSKGRTSPGREKLPKLAEALRVDPSYITNILDKEAAKGHFPEPRTPEEQAIYGPIDEKYVQWRKEAASLNVEPIDYISDKEAEEQAKEFNFHTGLASLAARPPEQKISMVPVLGVAIAGEASNCDFYLNGHISEYVDCPPGLKYSKNSYGIYVVSDSMSPKFEHGELLFVNPDRIAGPNDYVVIEIAPTEAEPYSAAFLKRLVRRAGGVIICEQFNPPLELRFNVEGVKAIHRVVPIRELLGL